MASYLRLRRGNMLEATSLVLKRGEVFFEISDNGIGTVSSNACGRIKMGDGSTIYGSLAYFIDVDTSVVAFTDTSTATSTNQGTDYYTALNAISPSSTVKSIFGNIKLLLYRMATNITTLNKKIPFEFGLDSSNNYGYIKTGTNTVIPFVEPPSGNINLGSFGSGTYSNQNVSGYETCSFTTTGVTPSGNINLGSFGNGTYTNKNVSGYETCSFTTTGVTPSGNKALGTYTTAGSKSANISGYATCSFTVSTTFSWTSLWTNDDPTKSFAAQSVTLSQPFTNFTLLKILWCYSTSYTTTKYEKIFRCAEVQYFSRATAAAGTYNGSIGVIRYKATGGSHNYVRSFCPSSADSTMKTIAFATARCLDTATDSGKAGLIIPCQILGGKVS